MTVGSLGRPERWDSVPGVTDSGAEPAAELAADLLAARDQLVRLRRLLELETARGNRLSQHLAESTDREAALHSSLGQAVEDRQALTSEVSRLRLECEQLRAERDGQVCALSAELGAATTRITALERTLEERQVELDGLRATRAVRFATRARSLARAGRRG